MAEQDTSGRPAVYQVGGGNIWSTLLPVLAVGGLGAAAYLLLFDKGIRNLRILSYRNASTGQTAIPPTPINIENGQTVEVKVGLSYKGDELSGNLHLAAWYKSLLDPHNETNTIDSPFSLPNSLTRKEYSFTIALPISGQSDQLGLYVRTFGLEKDIFSPYYSNVLIIGGGGESGFAFGTPTASPVSQDESQPVQITWPITNQSALAQTTRIVFNIHENDLFPTMGPLIASIEVNPVVFAPYETQNISISYIEDLFDIMPAHTYTSRNVGIEVWVGATKVATWNVTGLFDITGGESGFTLQLVAEPNFTYGAIATEPHKDYYLPQEVVKCTAGAIWPREFRYWKLDGVILLDDYGVPSADPILYLVMDTDHVLTAVFA